MSEDEAGAMKDFNEGFLAGYRGLIKEKGRTATYRNAYDRGREAAKRMEAFDVTHRD